MEKAVGRSNSHGVSGRAIIPHGIGEQSLLLRYCKTILISVAVGEGISILFLLLFSLIVCNVNLPLAASDILVVAAGAAGSFSAGYLAGRLLRERGILVGAICGCVMVVILFLLNIGFHESSTLAFFLCKLAVILLGSAGGGIAGVNKKSRRIKL